MAVQASLNCVLSKVLIGRYGASVYDIILKWIINSSQPDIIYLLLFTSFCYLIYHDKSSNDDPFSIFEKIFSIKSELPECNYIDII